MISTPSVIFQSSKLGDIPCILKELDRALSLFKENEPVGRIYGVSGGALTAMAFGLAMAAKLNPEKWGKAAPAITDFRDFLGKAHGWNIRSFNLNPLYGRSNLKPLRRWLASRLKAYTGRSDWRISDLGIPLYFCTIDRDAIFTMFGPEDANLQCNYQFVHLGPPTDASLLDAVIAALSTLLSTSPNPVNGKWVYDCRPSIVDAGAVVADLEAIDPRPILRTKPYAVIRQWPLNFISSVFIMHSQHERNQALLADYYLDLLRRQKELIQRIQKKQPDFSPGSIAPSAELPTLGHVNLPYVGSTEAATNMRQSVENRVEMMARFNKILNGQLDNFPFSKPA
ncbi:MAG: hypothetical protein NTZ34_11035, partial [Chloroflexi bacterium]|nr:hypothetical protein [Chloroflexota bacterium]